MYEQRPSDSPFIHSVWRAAATSDGEFTDPANTHWSLNFIRHADNTLSAELYGPSTESRILNWRSGEMYWGIDFNPHVTMHGLSKKDIMGLHITLLVDDGAFAIGGHRYVVPDYDNLELLVVEMQATGVLSASKLVRRALDGDTVGASERSLQRHVRQVTGLSRQQIEQIRRAQRAESLLGEGYSSAEAAQLAGYADQAHMTRAIKRAVGKTPRQLKPSA